MSDSHLSVAVVFDVPEGQDYKSYFPKFYAKVKSGTKDCLYYGFATCGNKVLSLPKKIGHVRFIQFLQSRGGSFPTLNRNLPRRNLARGDDPSLS